MSDKDLKMREEDLAADQLDEFKASFDVNAEVPEPVAKTAKAPGNSKKVKDEPAGAPSAVKPEKAKVAESKLSMIQAMIEKMNSMKKEDLAASFAAMEEALSVTAKGEADLEETVAVVQAGHKVTSEDIDIAEDIKALFAADETLTEEFKEAATTIFEAAVIAKVNEQLEKYVVDVETQLSEEVTQIKESMTVKLDQYLDYVVEQWMEENKLAVEKGIKSELVDDFISGLKDLFNEHYIEIPEDKVDVVEELAVRAEELETRLNEEMKKNATLKSSIAEHKRAEMLDQAGESLTESQKEKFKVLAEGIEFVSEEKFAEKLATIKSSYFEVTESAVSKVSAGDFDDAEPLVEEAAAPRLDSEMSRYVNAISRSLKK